MNYAIIAAGEGSRLVEEGISVPKPLVQLNGISLIDRLITIFCRNNATSISIIINNEMVEVQQYLQQIRLNIPLHLVVKSTPSSMHSFFELSPYLKEDKFCLTTVDTVFKEDEFSAYIQDFTTDNFYDGMMAVTDFVDDEKPLYVAVDPDTMLITAFNDSPSGYPYYISGGIYCLSPRAIPVLQMCMNQKMYRMRNYQRQLIAEGIRLKACPFKKIIDVDHAGDIEKAAHFLREQKFL